MTGAPGTRPVVTPADMERGRAIGRAWRNDPGRTGGSLAAMIAAALADARHEAVAEHGRCGNRPPELGGWIESTSVCELPAGHRGWHRDGGVEWGPRVDTPPEAVMHLDDGPGGPGLYIVKRHTYWSPRPDPSQ